VYFQLAFHNKLFPDDTHIGLIGDLWQVIYYLRSARNKLTVASLRVLLSLLSTEPEDPLFDGWTKQASQVTYCACAVLDSADHWFANNELRQIVHRLSLWANLSHGALFNEFYNNLGANLSTKPEWEHIISQDLPSWLGQWPTIETEEDFTDKHRAQFRSVLSRMCGTDETEATEFREEATMVMVFGALADTWTRVQFSDLTTKQVRYNFKLLRCIVFVAFSAKILKDREVRMPSQRFKDTSMVCLGEVLARAAGNARVELAKDSTMEQHLKDTIDGIASLLPKLGSSIQSELRTAETVTESKYCRISFNSAGVVTSDQKNRFGTSATDKFGVTPTKFRNSRRKFSKIVPFSHLQEEFGPDVTDFAFGSGRRDP
jgi:hypothetical protein